MLHITPPSFSVASLARPRPFLRGVQALLVVAALGFATNAQATLCPGAIIIPPASVPVSPATYGATLVCGGSNDLSSTTVPGALCGSGATASYKDGLEALYSFTPTITGQYLIQLFSVSWSSILVYQGCPTSNVCIATAASSANNETVTVNLTAGIQYFIWFDDWVVPNTSPCPGNFKISRLATVSNDNPCPGALVLCPSPDANCGTGTGPTPFCPAPSFKNASLTGATASAYPTPPCGGVPDNDVWFRFFPTQTGHLITLTGITGIPNTTVTTNLTMALYTGSCVTPTYVACTTSNVWPLTGLTIGVPYYVRVYTTAAYVPGNSTFFTICITTVVPTTCNGTFYDIAGPNADYANNANYNTTYCAPAGQVVSLIFSQFNTETADNVRIYDGSNTGFPLLGTYNGTSLPPVNTSSSNCLTLNFTSSPTISAPGWVGQMFCNPAPVVGAGKCTYALRMHDSGGDGWGAATITVRINGVIIGTYTVTGADNYLLFNVNIGDVFSMTYAPDTAPTANESQNTYSISKLGQAPYWSAVAPPVAGETFVHTVSCGPPPNVPQDCLGGITVCSAAGINVSGSGYGNFQDLSNVTYRGCLTAETQGTWIYFSPSSAGVIGFTIIQPGLEDYDFAVWGPYPNAHCPNTAPLRCSWAATAYTYTGLGNGAVDLSENGGGDGWVAPITVAPADVGKVYALYVNKFTSGAGHNFSLTWQLSGGCSLDCAVLPIELMEFGAHPEGQVIQLDWSTASEHNSDHFTVQRSVDNLFFENIGQVTAAGNSVQHVEYRFTDTRPAAGWNYYRLQMVDKDGGAALSYVVTANMGAKNSDKPMLYPNPVEDVLNVQWTGDPKGVQLIVRDALGRTVASGTPVNSHGSALQLPVDHVNSGCYTVGIVLPNGQEVAGGVFIKR